MLYYVRLHKKDSPDFIINKETWHDAIQVLADEINELDDNDQLEEIKISASDTKLIS